MAATSIYAVSFPAQSSHAAVWASTRSRSAGVASPSAYFDMSSCISPQRLCCIVFTSKAPAEMSWCSDGLFSRVGFLVGLDELLTAAVNANRDQIYGNAKGLG